MAAEEKLFSMVFWNWVLAKIKRVFTSLERGRKGYEVTLVCVFIICFLGGVPLLSYSNPPFGSGKIHKCFPHFLMSFYDLGIHS